MSGRTAYDTIPEALLDNEDLDDTKTYCTDCRKPPPAPDPCRALRWRLPALPNIMDHLGWTNGAALMRDWFSQTANDDPEKGIPNIHTIKMDWVLGYARAKAVYDKAIAERVWVNEKAKEKIEEKLIRKKNKHIINVGDKVIFGDAGDGVIFSPQLMQQFNDDYQFQYREVKGNLLADPLDDLFAALANFQFSFVAQGIVERLPDVNRKALYKVTLDKIGIYVRDSYDFNDKPSDLYSQPLGYWDCADKDVTKTPRPGAYYVTNEDFRKWRKKYGNGKGGDFLVFSDIKIINVSDSFEFFLK